MTPASPVPAADSAATDFAAVERAQRLERAKFLAGLTIPQLKGELDGLRAAGEEQDPREAQFLRTLLSARAATAVKQAEQIGSPMQLSQWAAAQIEDGQFDEQFFEDVISPVYAKKLQETPEFGMADVLSIGKAVPEFISSAISGMKGIAKNLPQAVSAAPAMTPQARENYLKQFSKGRSPEEAARMVQELEANTVGAQRAAEAIGTAAEQGTLEDFDLFRRTVRRAAQAFRRNALMAVNGDTPEKWEATRQKQLETLAKQKPDWTPEQLAQHPSVAPTWEEFNQGKLPLEEGRKQALTDVRTARAMVRAERGQRSVSAFDVASLLLGNNEKDWNQNRAALIEDMRARKLSEEAINKLVPPTWEEYAAAEKAKRPKLTEEQIKQIPGMGDFLAMTNFVPAGVGFEFASKLAKPTVAAMTLGEKVAPTVVQRAGKVVEGAGKVLGSSTGRAAVAVTAATAAGLEPTQAILAGVLANAPGGRQLSKAAPEIVKKAGQILQRPLPGPVGAMMNVAKATGKGAAAGAATMLPMAYFAGQTPEERGMLLAGGMVPGSVGGFSSGVLQFGQSYWAPQSKYSAERVASTSYGTPLDAAHNKATAGLDNAQFNSVEAVRDVVRRASGGSGQLYVLTPEDYAAKLEEIGQQRQAQAEADRLARRLDAAQRRQAGLPKAARDPGQGFSPSLYFRQRESNGILLQDNVAFVRLGGESLMHEPAHIFEHFLLPEERGQILGAITEAYSPEQMQEMKSGYERALGKQITLDQFISEVIAENFQAALNAGPLRKLGTPSKVAREVYAALGRLGERMGFRDLSPGGPVQTSETLRFTPSFLVQQALLNVLEAQKLDGLKPASTPQQAVQQASQVPTQPSVPAPIAPAPVAPAPATPTPVAPRTVDVGALNPVPVELINEPSVPVPGAISGIPQTPKPAAPAPATPAPAPAPAATTTTNVRGVTEQARAPFKGPTPETKKHNVETLTAELNKAQADRVPLQTDYFAAVDQDNNPKKLTQPQREFQRRLAETADRLGYKNPLRRLYEKMFIPLSGFKTAKGDTNVFAFSMDKLIQNLDILRGWAEENGKPDIVAMVEDPQLAADVQTYLANQANGYGGGGERLKRPAGTDPARYPAENKNYTPVPLSPERRQFINFLMGLEGVADKTPLSPAAAFVVELAKLNGIGGANVVPETEGRSAKLEFNPVAQQFRAAGFDPILLNQVVEQLRTDRMGTPLRRREDINLRAGVQGSIQAGFMPSAPGQPIKAEENRGRFANPKVRQVADEYLRKAGMPSDPHGLQIPVNEDLAKRIADFYEASTDAPSAPEVKAAYNALADEVMSQYATMVEAGVKIEPWLKPGQPYTDSADMMRDVRDNNRLYFFLTEGGFGSGQPANVDNAMLRDSGVTIGGKKLLVNDIFRAVHDYFGHAMNGYEFGPRGEFNAYLEHSRMFSPEAKPALAAETLAQNSWVNYGEHLRNTDGTLPKKGQPGYVAPADRPFAPQKNIVIPENILSEVDDYARFMPANDRAYSLLSRDGNVIPVRGGSHAATASLLLFRDAKTPGEALERAFSAGYARLAHSGEDLYVDTRGNALTDRQRSEVENIAMESGKARIVLDTGDDYRTIWTRDESSPDFMPADKAPKRDVEYLGVVTSDGVRMVSVPRGSEKFHDEVGLSRGDRFRYDPKSGNVVWTDLREEVDKRTRDFLSAWLDMRGYKVGRQADWSGRAYGQWMPAAPRKGAKEWVDTAAIRTEDGQIFTGTSHFAAVQAAVSAGVDFDRTQATDGFLTNTGNFVDREEGYRIANAAGQLDQRAQDSSVRFGSEAAPVLESAALEGAGNRIAEKRSRPVTRGQLMPAGDGNVRRLNIGLKIGRTDTLLTTDEVLAVLKDMGFEPGRTQVRQSGTEPTLIVDIPADNVTPETMNQLSTALQQEAIAVYNPTEDIGALYGPKAADWGPFNKAYFLDFEDAAPQFMPAPPVNSEAFKKWFGDSKVVDARGRPRRVYHGTSADFTVFDPNSSAAREGSREGLLYFTDNRALARDFSSSWDGEAGNLMQVFLKMERPLLVDAKGADWGAVVYDGTEMSLDDLAREARRSGYDGLIAENVTDSLHGPDRLNTTYVAFEPTQVKSATDNVGTFDAGNPDIRYMPAKLEGERLEHAVPEKTLKLTHFSNVAGLNVVDPAFMSQDTTKKLLRGDPRSFWMVGESKLKNADGAKGKSQKYTAEVSGSKLYDMRSDPLNLWEKPQPQIDKTLKADGYAGFVMETNDGRTFAAVYEAIPLNPKGEKEAKARAAEEAKKQAALANVKVPRKIQAEQKATLKRDRTWEEVLAEADRTGKPLDEVAKKFGVDFMPALPEEFEFSQDRAAQFMPAPRVDLEDFIGKTVITMPIDRLGIGEVEVGPQGSRRTMQAQGGRGYPLLYEGEGWAFSTDSAAKSLLTRLRQTNPGEKTGLVATAVLTETNLLKSKFGQLAFANAYEAAIDAGIFSRRSVDRMFKEVFARSLEASKSPSSESSSADIEVLKGIKTLADFKAAAEQGKITFTVMREVGPRLDAKRLAIPFEERQAAGVTGEQIARDVMDPELIGLPNFSVVSLLEIDLDQTPHKNSQHVSYPWGVKGRLVGFMRVPYELQKLTDEPRIRTKRGVITTQPVQTVLPTLSSLKVSETNPNPRETLRSARVAPALQTE